MKSNTVFTLIAAGLTTFCADAASYYSDFSRLAPGDSLVGFEGWGQSTPNVIAPATEPGVEPSSDASETPWAYGTTSGSNPAATVGGYYNTDELFGGEFHASHTISFAQDLVFDMNFAIHDSVGFELEQGGPLFGTERNSF